MWLAWLMGVTASVDRSLDGVYGAFPPSSRGPATLFQGSRVVQWGPHHRQEGTLRVEPSDHLLTLSFSGRTSQWTYDVRNGVLLVGVLVRAGDRWTVRRGWDPATPCVVDNQCLDWDGEGHVDAFGNQLQLDDESRRAGVRVLGFSEAVGPVGRLPAPEPVSIDGRWWALEAPGTEVRDGFPNGWMPRPWWQGDDRTLELGPGLGSVHLVTYEPHGFSAHTVFDGRLMWFLATDGRLLVHHLPSGCEHGDVARWADLERID